LYNWMHSAEMCLPHLTQPLWIREVRVATINRQQCLRQSGIWSSNLSVTGTTLQSLVYLLNSHH
jgi:hypothetical protein